MKKLFRHKINIRWSSFTPPTFLALPKADTRANTLSPQATPAPAPAPPKTAPSPVLVIIIIQGITGKTKCRYCESNSTGKKLQDQIFVSLLIPPPPPPPPYLYFSSFPFPSSPPSQEYCINSLLWIKSSVSSLSSDNHF